MFTRPWIFLINPFQSATKGNYMLGLTLSTYLDAALNAAKSDMPILKLYDYYHPIHVAYMNAYNAWLAQGGTQKGSTLSLKNVLAGLIAKVNTWDFQVQNVYAKGTPGYVAIFPNGHRPFVNGKQSQRISHVESLDTALTGIVALATTKTDVHNYALLLDSVNTTQKGNKFITNTASDLVEAQRIIMCKGKMYCYGGLVQQYNSSLDRVGEFFDLEILRSGSQRFFINTVQPHKTVNIFKRTLDTHSELEIINTGTESVSFFLSNKKTGTLGSVFVDVAAGALQIISLAALGDVATMHFLNVVNEHNNTTSCSVKIL